MRYSYFMIYSSYERAQQVADTLNQDKGYAPALAILTTNGWTVIRSYRFIGADGIVWK